MGLTLFYKTGNDPDNPDWFEGREDVPVILANNERDVLRQWLDTGHVREYGEYPGKRMLRAMIRLDGGSIGDLMVDTALDVKSDCVMDNLVHGFLKVVGDHARENVFGRYVAEMKGKKK